MFPDWHTSVNTDGRKVYQYEYIMDSLSVGDTVNKAEEENSSRVSRGVYRKTGYLSQRGSLWAKLLKEKIAITKRLYFFPFLSVMANGGFLETSLKRKGDFLS